MHLQIITIYCLCADFVAAYGYHDDPQAKMTTPEVMTAALVAAWFFSGNQTQSRSFLSEHGYMPTMLSASRFNRRLHAIPETLWQGLFALLGQIHQQHNKEAVYSLDTCPVPVCDNIRIRRCRLYRGEDYRGYCASKRRYYFGLKLHLVVTSTGKPVEIVLTPASTGDVSGLRLLGLELPEEADLYADKAYNDYTVEDTLLETAQVHLCAQRKRNSKRALPGYVSYLCQQYRKCIETTFSQVSAHLPRRIQAVTARGFELKVFLTVLAFSILA